MNFFSHPQWSPESIPPESLLCGLPHLALGRGQCFLFCFLKKISRTKQKNQKTRKNTNMYIKKYYLCVFTYLFCLLFFRKKFSTKTKKGTKKKLFKFKIINSPCMLWIIPLVPSLTCKIPNFSSTVVMTTSCVTVAAAFKSSEPTLTMMLLFMYSWAIRRTPGGHVADVITEWRSGLMSSNT